MTMEDRRPSSSSSSSCTGALCNGKVDSECGDINLKSIMGEGVDGHDGIVVYQAHENDEAVMCVVQEPNSAANFLGNLHPCGKLHEQPFDLESARTEHQCFVRAMESFGVKVVKVEDVLSQHCFKGEKFDMKKRMRLEDLALKQLTYRLSPKCDASSLTREEAFYLSDEYKLECIERMNASQLVQVILTCPTVTLDRSHRDTTMIAVEHSMNPLGNLIFTRDQQITTKKGIVMANMAAKQRAGEVDLMVEVMENLGAPVIGRITSPATLEGGDFFMAGDTCFVGTGLRTNSLAITQLLEGDLVGCDYVVEVRDMFDRSQDRMHLDCCFNIVGDDLVLLTETIDNPRSLTRRLVTEYTRDPATSRYAMTRSDVEFSTYLRARSFHIQSIPEPYQLLYGINCLNLGNSNLIMMHRESARLLARNPHFKGTINVVDYRNVSSMYGSLHCTSQVVRRRSSHGKSARLPYSIKPCSPLPVLKDERPAAVLFVPEDAALIFRDCGSRGEDLKNLKARDVQVMVLKEVSALHLMLQALNMGHIHVIGREESYFKSNEHRISPSAFISTFNSQLVLFSCCSALQSKAVTSCLSYAFTELPIQCPVKALRGGLDLVIFQNDGFISSAFKGNDVLESWAADVGMKLVFIDLVQGVDLPLVRLLFICTGVVLVRRRMLADGAVDAIKRRLPDHAVVDVDDDCLGMVEMTTRKGDQVLVASDGVLSRLPPHAVDALQRTHAGRIVECDLATCESIGIGGVRDLLVPLRSWPARPAPSILPSKPAMPGTLSNAA
ncbi:Arginine deiminase [Plasmodiophora brassicae]